MTTLPDEITSEKRFQFGPVLTFALRGVLRRPVHTLLLLFALTMSLAATMTIMAVLTGIDVQMRDDLARVGMDVINIHINPNMKNVFFSPLHVSDADRIHATWGGAVAPFRVSVGMGSAPDIASDGANAGTVDDSIEGNIAGANDNDRTPSAQVLVLTTSHDWAEVVPLEFLAGRFFSDGERGVCVLDEWVAETVFGSAASAIDRDMTVKGLGAAVQLSVVGVMKDPFEIRKRFDELDVTNSARSRLLRMMEFKSIYVPGSFDKPSKPIHGAVLKVPPGSDPLNIAAQIRNSFRGGTEHRRVAVWARRHWVDNVIEAAGVGLQIANVIWIIVLGVTCIMIMTVSLVAIRERFREIAIRRTEGALRNQIVAQLLLENMLLSILAGTIAIGLARWTGAVIHANYLSWRPAFVASDTALALTCGILMGAIATILPAWHASQVDPVTVLKAEA